MSYPTPSNDEEASLPPAGVYPQLVWSHSKQNVIIGDNTVEFMHRFWPDATLTNWKDWRWQLKNRLTNPDDFTRVLNITPEEYDLIAARKTNLPVSVTPYYASICAEKGHALRKTIIPSKFECQSTLYEDKDPLAEDHDSPVPGLVHRYPDRVLLMVTDFCSVYCRYCTRSRRVGRTDTNVLRKPAWTEAIEYIASHPEIRDVVVSGGDPLTLADTVLENILISLSAIEHVEVIRIGTKVPMVLPQRITHRLLKILKKIKTLYMSIHCTHPDELTDESCMALAALADAGIVLGSQTVLLADVNDDEEVMKKLFRGLMKHRVRPYYLYECDQVSGTAHFRTPVSRGVDIIKSLRGYTSGYAIPQFVVDLPGGGGKVPLLPEYLEGRNGEDLLFKNYEGNTYLFHDPATLVGCSKC
ncbi:KamA family radical SAM protein [Halodesulfovibrio aestuarii]|uniref:KamA family radical SAM protein n=1 Tax=Halodesulfovibrio aestuarii TaxID=126333 RepID=UPI000424FC51